MGELPRPLEASPKSSLAQTLGKKLNQAEAELSSTQESMRVAQRQIVSLTIDLERALDTLQRNDEEIKSKNETIKEQAARIDELNGTLNKMLDKESTEKSEQEISINSGVDIDAREVMEVALKEANSKLDDAKNEIDANSEAMGAILLDLETTKKQLRRQGHTIDELNEVISGLEVEKNSLKTETDILINELRDQVINAHENHPLHAEVKTNRAEMAELYTVIEGLEDERAKFKKLINSQSGYDNNNHK